MKRTVILMVLDSVGIGALPDADKFGDANSNTLGHVLDASPDLTLPQMSMLGLGRLLKHDQLDTSQPPMASYGRGMTLTKAKDTISGHWEMMGIVQEVPFQIFPQGFPAHVVRAIEEKIGRKFIGNNVASGTEIIAELGDEHIRTGSPILYTSADSVLQIAAHEEVIALTELYAICETAREVMRGDCNVARIIARPFTGNHPFTRTPNRKDYAVIPPRPTAVDQLLAAGFSTIGVGKICDIYANVGFSECIKTKSNADGLQKTAELYEKSPNGLIFTNLVEFDSHYGHRNDARGYGLALRDVDDWLAVFLPQLLPGDWLFITADHGCDPAFPGTDHTREYVPILAYSPDKVPGYALGDRASLTDIGATILELFGLRADFPADAFARQLEG